MTDPVKQREMEVKVTQSQQKISEWQEELKHLKGFTHFSIVYSVHVHTENAIMWHLKINFLKKLCSVASAFAFCAGYKLTMYMYGVSKHQP